MIVLVVVAAALTACGSDNSGGAGTTGTSHRSATPATVDDLVACDDLVGESASALAGGCTAPDGSIEAVATYPCDNGADLVLAGGGDRSWWARKDGTVQAGPRAAFDSEYAACVSDG